MSLDLDWWNALFKTTSVILAALTFIAGAGALLTERAVTARQSRQLAQMERDSAQQRERAANAERDAAAAKSGTLDALAQVAAANQRTETLAIQAAEQQERAARRARIIDATGAAEASNTVSSPASGVRGCTLRKAGRTGAGSRAR